MVGIKNLSFKAKRKKVALTCIQMTKHHIQREGDSWCQKEERGPSLHRKPNCLSISLTFKRHGHQKPIASVKNSWHTLHPSKIHSNTMSVFTSITLNNVIYSHAFFCKIRPARIYFLYINPILLLY